MFGNLTMTNISYATTKDSINASKEQAAISFLVHPSSEPSPGSLNRFRILGKPPGSKFSRENSRQRPDGPLQMEILDYTLAPYDK
jgi:hypothetical protein